jgi:hypothetical protein
MMSIEFHRTLHVALWLSHQQVNLSRSDYGWKGWDSRIMLMSMILTGTSYSSCNGSIRYLQTIGMLPGLWTVQ